MGFEWLPPLGQSGLCVVTSTGTQWALSGHLHWDRVGFEWLPLLGQGGLCVVTSTGTEWALSGAHIQLEFSAQEHLCCRLQC